MKSDARGEQPLVTGVPGFDDLVDGGLPRNRLYVLCGPPGSGKTTFSARLVAEGARAGERCLYLTMHETRHELIDDMSAYDFNFEGAAESKAVEFVNVIENDANPVWNATSIDRANKAVSQLTNRLVGYVDSRDIDRVIVDSTMLLEHFLSKKDDDLLPFLVALKRADATVFLISEMTDPSEYAQEHFLAHGVIYFHNFLENGSMRRGIQVLKLRGVETDADIRDIRFTDAGVTIEAQ